MTTHTDLIKRLRALTGPARLAAADALEAQDTTIEALRAEVAALTKEHEFACEIGADYRDKWMAAQAREAKMLEALVDYDNQASEYDGRTSKELGDRIKSLLASPTDDSALQDALKAERGRCIAACEETADIYRQMHNPEAENVADACADAIRGIA